MGLWIWAVVGAVSLAGARPAHAQLTNTDKQALAQLALQWAVDGGIPDVKLLKDAPKLVVVDQNLPPRTELHIAKRTVTLLPPIRVQVAADMHSDFLYFRFGPIAGDKNHATVPIALVWAVGVRSKAQYLSGGGTTLQFQQRDGKWTLLPVNERWSS